MATVPIEAIKAFESLIGSPEDCREMFDDGSFEVPVASDGITSFPLVYQTPVDPVDRIVRTDILVVDIDKKAEYTGYGRVLHFRDADSAVSHMPFVAGIQTFEAYRKRGQAFRRYQVLNRLAESQFGLPLHSDYIGATSDLAVKTWRKLIREGLAETYQEPLTPRTTATRYRFLPGVSITV